jgi:hypothetical protein
VSYDSYNKEKRQKKAPERGNLGLRREWENLEKLTRKIKVVKKLERQRQVYRLEGNRWVFVKLTTEG